MSLQSIQSLQILKTLIPSETDNTKSYEFYYVLWKNEETPKEIICSCPGYQYHGKCKHLEKYDPMNCDLWKAAKKVN